MSGGKYFTTLGLANTFLQLPLDLNNMLLSIPIMAYSNTLGVSSAPAIFQRHMDTLFQGLDKVSAYVDDIITGSTLEEHLQVLDKVLQILKSAGL